MPEFRHIFIMAFVSKNELDKFSFADCVCSGFARDNSTIKLTLDALIVKANNSQNSNYTDSYADVTECTIEGVEILAVLKEGYTRYDADDNIIEEVNDEPVAPCDYAEIYKLIEGAYLSRFFKTKEDYLLEFELADEVGAMADSYEFRLTAKDIIFKWDRYLNRVQY